MVSKNISDVISISDIFIGYSNQIFRNFEDGVSLSDLFTYTARDRFLTEEIEEDFTSLIIKDEFSFEVNVRDIKELVDSIGILDILDWRVQQYPIKNLEDIVSLSDLFVSSLRIAPIKNLNDVISIIDLIDDIYTIRYTISLEDNVLTMDDIDELYTLRTSQPVDNLVSITDTLDQQWGIIVNNGTGGGSYNLNEVVQLGAIVPTGFTFFKWEFNKAGINNIYDPDTTITIPYGGGVITALFVETDSLVTIYDIYDFEYIDNEDINDEIHTNEIASPTTGGFMGVANHDFEIPQGARFHNIIIYRDANSDPVDLTGYTAEMQIRKYKAASDPAVLILNTSNGYLALGGEAGTITIDTPGNVTDPLDFKWGYYDLELYPDGDSNNTIRILEGRIELSKQVTR